MLSVGLGRHMTLLEASHMHVSPNSTGCSSHSSVGLCCACPSHPHPSPSCCVVIGTVGEWLRYAASPLERRNFEELLTLLDEFSHDRGLSNRGAVGGEGVSVRLGSLLTAQITFHLAAT